MLGVVTGSGRCGTHSLAQLLDGSRRADGGWMSARHETAWRTIVADLHRGQPDLARRRVAGFEHDIEVSAYLLLADAPPHAADGTPLPLLGLIRDGRETVRSGMTHGWYWNPELPDLSWVALLPAFDGDRFERCCQYWSWAFRRLEAWGATIATLERLAADSDERACVLSLFGAERTDRAFPHQNATSFVARVREDRRWPGAFPAYAEWSARQRSAFERHCGEAMDPLYPGWRGDTAGR